MVLKVKYNFGPYNKFDKREQWIRISEGCPHHHSYCYEPTEIKIFEIPKIVRNDVKIIDMNLLCKSEALGIIKKLSEKRVNGKIVYYEFVCGIDFRFLTQEISDALKESHFRKIRLAWDGGFEDQKRIKKAIDILIKSGYKPNDIMLFMICNWEISYEERLQEMDLCKVWNVQIADCWYDNQLSPNIIPIRWTTEQIKEFRRKVRKHNQLVNFKIDPEYKPQGTLLLKN